MVRGRIDRAHALRRDALHVAPVSGSVSAATITDDARPSQHHHAQKPGQGNESRGLCVYAGNGDDAGRARYRNRRDSVHAPWGASIARRLLRLKGPRTKLSVRISRHNRVVRSSSCFAFDMFPAFSASSHISSSLAYKPINTSNAGGLSVANTKEYSLELRPSIFCENWFCDFTSPNDFSVLYMSCSINVSIYFPCLLMSAS